MDATSAALMAAASLAGNIKMVYGFQLDFPAGNVSDSASAFRHMWDAMFPNSPRASSGRFQPDRALASNFHSLAPEINVRLRTYR